MIGVCAGYWQQRHGNRTAAAPAPFWQLSTSDLNVIENDNSNSPHRLWNMSRGVAQALKVLSFLLGYRHHLICRLDNGMRLAVALFTCPKIGGLMQRSHWTCQCSTVCSFGERASGGSAPTVQHHKSPCDGLLHTGAYLGLDVQPGLSTRARTPRHISPSFLEQ